MIKEIQGLRFFAILMVIFVHSPIIFPNDWMSERRNLESVSYSYRG